MMDVDVELARLDALSSSDLRQHWRTLVGTSVPKISPKMLRLALAWEIQARAAGGLPRGVAQALDQLGRGQTRTQSATAGMRLVREWAGRVHVVTVEEDAFLAQPRSAPPLHPPSGTMFTVCPTA
ncbi:DUF2924 domain-containing protein [Sphingomonas sp. Leaf38]|uniref:DUF2924 domain-containing protein n=1 Tax=Sphingomonas sp. Leaf38 TaxID=1736217 RepID=UPI000700520E|nr:DUF2924 domain-containing protein [Sphingomonas sp. Leaf38]KQN24715.1 hypothetical protein ASE88_16930 [Sphingomonas sp. Leaf38]